MSGVELDCALGHVDVENVVLRLTAHGNWDATMDIPQPARPDDGTPGTLRIARSDGTIDTFTGSVRRSMVTAGTTNLSVTIVGGNGRLIDEIPACHHTSGSSTVPAGLVLKGIADAAGYTLAAGVEAALDAYPLARWTRVRQPADFALNNLAAFLGLEWRVFADGTLWMGAETWPPVDASAFYWRGDPRDGAVWFVPDGAPYRPGTTLYSRPGEGARIVETTYAITPGRPAMEARAAVRGDPVYPPQLAPYARAYVATVVSQDSSSLLLNLRAQDPALGDDLRDVPFKLGIPGTKVTVPAGSIVRVAFESGQPDGIYASDINMDASAAKAFSLIDDATANGSFTALGVAPGAPIQFIYTPPGGSPQSGPTVTITGKITGPGHAYAKGVPGS